jgi:hypothetical protein
MSAKIMRLVVPDAPSVALCFVCRGYVIKMLKI